MQPLSESEARWARSLGLLQKKESYWSMLRKNLRHALKEIAVLLIIVACISVIVLIVGVM